MPHHVRHLHQGESDSSFRNGIRRPLLDVSVLTPANPPMPAQDHDVTQQVLSHAICGQPRAWASRPISEELADVGISGTPARVLTDLGQHAAHCPQKHTSLVTPSRAAQHHMPAPQRQQHTERDLHGVTLELPMLRLQPRLQVCHAAVCSVLLCPACTRRMLLRQSTSLCPILLSLMMSVLR